MESLAWLWESRGSSLASPGTRPGEFLHIYDTHTPQSLRALWCLPAPRPPPHPWPWEEASGAPAELEGKYKSSRHVSVASAEFEAGGRGGGGRRGSPLPAVLIPQPFSGLHSTRWGWGSSSSEDSQGFSRGTGDGGQWVSRPLASARKSYAALRSTRGSLLPTSPASNI